MGFFGHNEPEVKPPRYEVQKEHIVTIDYTLADDEGNFVDTTEGKGVLSYLHGSDQILESMQAALKGCFSGDHVSRRLVSKKAFGAYDEEKTQEFERPLFDAENIEEGMRFEMMTDEGLRVVTVLDVDDHTIKVDLNHPLAGKDLNFEATVVSVRPASPDELERDQVRHESVS